MKSQNKPFAQRERKKGKQREPVSGANGLSFWALCYQQYGLELSFRDYLKGVFLL